MGKLITIWVIELIVNIYDIITLPLYYLIQRPWSVRKEALKVRARQVSEFTWVNVDDKLDKSKRRSVDTLDELFRESVRTYADNNCLGVRKILAIEYKDQKAKIVDQTQEQSNQGLNHANGIQTNGFVNKKVSQELKRTKVKSKYILDDKYTWHSYGQVDQFVRQLSAGLTRLCDESIQNLDGSRKLLICADTCMEWFLMAHACFRNNITVVTAYTTLDDDAILHSIKQTEVRILVVSQKFASRVEKIVSDAPLIDTVIVLDKPLPGDPDETNNLKSLLGSSNVTKILSYYDILIHGLDNKESIASKPKGHDIAVIMYTSGSSGKAKGVLLSHRSIVYTALAFSGPGDIDHRDRYIGYLPLGHVLELAAECIFLRNGSTIAYSSPLTLTNASPMIKKGQSGDAFIFKPTIIGAVPLVLDRVRNGIHQAIKSNGPFWDQLINDFVIRYKRYWWERYYDTPIMNLLICRRFNRILGGEVRAICSGGAALSRQTQEYLRHVGNFTVLQGYGLTETSAAASFCDIHDRRYNVVGPPYPIVRIKLESWCDYSVYDKPYPRGEIIIGGQPVSEGYYKMDELTKESFFVQDNIRYFRTGDIGLMLPDGCLKIIDRKKDIVKPLSGEYISLSEIETAISTAPGVENLFVYCSQYSNHIVAIVRPEARELHRMCRLMFEESKEFRESISKHLVYKSDEKDSSLPLAQISPEILCSNKHITDLVLKMIQEEGSKKNLKRTQLPSKIKLVYDEWSPESGLVTASFKLRRRELELRYSEAIKQLYADLGQKIEQTV